MVSFASIRPSVHPSATRRSGEAVKWRSGVVDWTSAKRCHLQRKGGSTMSKQRRIDYVEAKAIRLCRPRSSRLRRRRPPGHHLPELRPPPFFDKKDVRVAVSSASPGLCPGGAGKRTSSPLGGWGPGSQLCRNNADADAKEDGILRLEEVPAGALDNVEAMRETCSGEQDVRFSAWTPHSQDFVLHLLRLDFVLAVRMEDEVPTGGKAVGRTLCPVHFSAGLCVANDFVQADR
jgi:hypothetical protein